MEKSEGELYKKIDNLLDEWVEEGKDEVHGYIGEGYDNPITASDEFKKVLDEVKKEFPEFLRTNNDFSYDCVNHIARIGDWRRKWFGSK